MECSILASCFWVKLIPIDFDSVVPDRGLCLQGPRQGAAGQAHYSGVQAAKPRAESVASTGTDTLG
jgi:hypothetical protein